MKPAHEVLFENSVSRLGFLPLEENQKISPAKSLQVIKTLALLWRNYQTRQQLRNLSPEQLQDIGITHDQALMEAKKHFWK
jgi:uncharacterized protein YjiS (DUF1127 family)